MPDRARPLKRSITISGHRTSLSLEQPFWDSLAEFARADGVSMNRLLTEIDEDRASNLSSAARIYVLERLRREAGRTLIPPAGSASPPGSA